MINQQEPICALATPSGIGAIGVIRVSGKGTFDLVNQIFSGKDLNNVAPNTIHFGLIKDGNETIDEVLISVFKSPSSFTKEDVVEISCHGSDYIIKKILKLLIGLGIRLAQPGEYTQRAFLNGQFDLVQAEAVADLIAADSAASHAIAINQLRGGFSKKLAVLRSELIHFASMVELELDFGEEDVEFADRDDLKALILNLQSQILPLINSFDEGNAIKEGYPVAIIGAPNAGKSTLLNTLLNEEKAIVTEIAGTTRDVIEDILIIDGIKFRIIDTAGIRDTLDKVERIGIERSVAALEKASLVLFLYDNIEDRLYLENTFKDKVISKELIWVRNKIDLESDLLTAESEEIQISAQKNINIELLKSRLTSITKQKKQGEVVLSNLRHYSQLVKANEALTEVLIGLNTGITGDFLAQDIRLSLHHLGEITGSITTDDLLDNIFSKFCIGK